MVICLWTAWSLAEHKATDDVRYKSGPLGPSENAIIWLPAPSGNAWFLKCLILEIHSVLSTRFYQGNVCACNHSRFPSLLTVLQFNGAEISNAKLQVLQSEVSRNVANSLEREHNLKDTSVSIRMSIPVLSSLPYWMDWAPIRLHLLSSGQLQNFIDLSLDMCPVNVQDTSLAQSPFTPSLWLPLKMQ